MAKRHRGYRSVTSKHRSTGSARKALRGLSANKIGVSGDGHGLDDQLAWVKEGDLVIPPHALTPELVEKLKRALGTEWSAHVVGQGREIDLQDLITNLEVHDTKEN